jgi:biofilm PGA synthesis N-glycosyltransferase PgaC
MVVVVSLLLSYTGLVLVLWWGWEMAIQKTVRGKHSTELRCSVIIPVRNEQHNIHSLINDLINQNYKNFEIIFVDDHSTDGTLVNLHKITLDNFKVISTEGEGKKSAITSGIKYASGSIIVTTDADCSVGENWLRSINQMFQEQDINMAFGGVRFRNKINFFSSLQTLEFASLIGSGAAALSFGKPIMCNGANLSYKKSVFENVGGYDGNLNIPSGDDEFLLRKIESRYPNSIKFIADQDAIVTTEAQSSFYEFLQQRIRWAGKWRYNSSVYSKFLAVYILVVQCLTIFSLITIFIAFEKWILIALAAKFISENAFLWRVCRYLKIRWRLLPVIALQFIYPFYVIGIGLASNFMSFNWKQRRHVP